MDPIEIPADLTAPYAPPADATPEQLAELRAAAREQAIALLDGDTTDETVAQAEWLASAVDVITDAEAAITADGEQADRAAALRERLNPPAETVDETDGDQGGDGGTEIVDAADAVPAGEPALVAAAPRQRTRVANVAARAPRPVVPAAARSRATLTASADSGVTAGSEIDWMAAAGIFERRARSFPQRGGMSRMQTSVAQINIPIEDALLASGAGDLIDLDEALSYAVDESRLTGGSLLASAGWCAPSEVLYDLLNLSTRDGLISIPEIGVRRGGVKWSTGPDFGAVFGASGLFGTQTEAQNIADTAKTNYTVPCPSWQEARLAADYMNLQAEILATKGFPEGIADFMQKAQIAFAHYVNVKTIADLVAGSTAVDLSTATPVAGAVTDTLAAVELQVTDIRYRHRLSLTDTLELVFPEWAKGVFRADLAKRLGLPDPFAVTDAQLTDWFKLRGAAPQFVYDWQDAFSGVTSGFGASTPIVAWPTSMKFLVYPAGTFARAIEPVISLDAVYDSTLLAANKYTALFQEQGRATIKRGLTSRVVTVDVYANGFTGPIALAAAAAL